MRTNRTIDEYIAKLESEISVLESVIRHLEAARELYKTNFVGLRDPAEKSFLNLDRGFMVSNIRNANSHIDWIRREIERAKFRANNRAWWRSFRQRMNAVGMNQSSPSCEELPF